MLFSDTVHGIYLHFYKLHHVQQYNLRKMCCHCLALIDVNNELVERFVCEIDFLQTLGLTGKRLYLYYQHDENSHFIDILNGDETMAMKEINNMIAVKEEIPGITGLIITDFSVRTNILYGSTNLF